MRRAWGRNAVPPQSRPRAAAARQGGNRVGGLGPVAHFAEYPARVRDGIPAVAQQLHKVAVPALGDCLSREKCGRTLQCARRMSKRSDEPRGAPFHRRERDRSLSHRRLAWAAAGDGRQHNTANGCSGLRIARGRGLFAAPTPGGRHLRRPTPSWCGSVESAAVVGLDRSPAAADRLGAPTRWPFPAGRSGPWLEPCWRASNSLARVAGNVPLYWS